MNRIVIEGQQLRVVHYNGSLWRADYNYMIPGSTARANYAGARYKYFTLSREELGNYTRRGMSNIKEWETQRPLLLINIMDPATRHSLERLVGDQHISIAFPMNNGGRPYRVSEEDTMVHDDAFLEQLCRLGVDGYYMERQEARPPNVGVFHSEVGLCATAFDALRLSNIYKSQNAPRANRVGTKRRRNNRNNNSSSNNNVFVPKIRRMKFNNTKNNIKKLMF